MDARSRLVLAGVAALVAAMLGRMGWVDWLAVLHTAEKVGCIALIILSLFAAFVGVPVAILSFLIWELFRLLRDAPPEVPAEWGEGPPP